MFDERRQHPRVELPIEVMLSHPAVGDLRTTARDISEGGIFVDADAPSMTLGAKIKLTILGLPLLASTPTPTINMEVTRVAAEGLGLKFDGAISKHLWASVERFRDEVAVGRDYFQVFQCALVVRDDRVLVVQEHGKWLYPGSFLVVGQDWRPALIDFLETMLGMQEATFVETLEIESVVSTLPENAMFAVFHRFTTNQRDLHVSDDARFDQYRWISADRDLSELSFSDERLRTLARKALENAAAERAATADQ